MNHSHLPAQREASVVVLLVQDTSVALDTNVNSPTSSMHIFAITKGSKNHNPHSFHKLMNKSSRKKLNSL